VASYDGAWLRQFDSVRSVQANIRHKFLNVGHTALPWHLGRGYDFLQTSGPPEKEADISAICSDKAMTSGHRRRLRFVDELLREYPMQRYGRGYTEIADKWEGLARYRYSLAIENSRHPHYWTEKITDCFLAGTVPIYWGAPNIGDYFPKEAMIVLDSLDASRALRVLRDGISKEDYVRRLPALREAKTLVMENYNLFELVARIAAEAPATGVSRPVFLRPERRSRIRSFVRKLTDLIQP
jgi:Glycosyltransferase family 10 (fucosyltransferase) C-term